MTSPYGTNYDDTVTVESLSEQVEDLTSKLSMLVDFCNRQFDACACEHCGHINHRKDMLAVFGLDKGTDGKEHRESSRWFCGYCVHAACVSLGGNQQECRNRIGQWLALGSGRSFLRELDSHFQHLGPGNDRSPVAEHLRNEFAPEIAVAARRAR